MLLCAINTGLPDAMVGGNALKTLQLHYHEKGADTGEKRALDLLMVSQCSKTWTILPQHGPNHLGLRLNAGRGACQAGRDDGARTDQVPAR